MLYLRIFWALFLLPTLLSSQNSTNEEVYRIFQQKCQSCHSNALKTGGLDLEGQGATQAQKMLNVYQKIYKVSPNNTFASQRGDKLIYPGRADKSFIFKKINSGLEESISLGPNDGNAMPNYPSAGLSNTEKEIIRQWILFGAPSTGSVVNTAVVDQFYTSGGIKSFEKAPPAPLPGEGFQIKMGPFFLAPLEEKEFYQKWEVDFADDIEVTGLDFNFGSFSHHFLLYNFTGGSELVPHGLREDANHNQIKLVAAVQQSTPIILPRGTAFFWEQHTVLDLNSHYINYSASLPVQCEAYVNVYTKPKGYAKQEMIAELLANIFISIPNSGNIITQEQAVVRNQNVFLWGMMGHTHKYGKNYKAFLRNPNGTKGEMIYDAACFNGTPGCPSPYFDYRHIPFKKIEPLKLLKFNPGIIHQAEYLNDGPNWVGWGATSKEEMMILIVFYTKDTVGVTTASEDLDKTEDHTFLEVYPNPMQDQITIENKAENYKGEFILYNNIGHVLLKQVINQPKTTIDIGLISEGVYYYVFTSDNQETQKGKLIKY
ncbi:MAG: T9SS type A sorting domain-containing protein [Bacteroidota bacterium]|nr:T9SS type A sorting domain-containing protein [Bacteroidota bacterium]